MQCRKQVDLWEHTFYFCADITEKSNSTESREPFQGSQNAKLYLRTKATWVKASQPPNLKSCRRARSFVFTPPLPAFSLTFLPSRSTLSSCKYGTANGGGAANQSSFTCSRSFKARRKPATTLPHKLFIKKFTRLKQNVLQQVDYADWRVWEINKRAEMERLSKEQSEFCFTGTWVEFDAFARKNKAVCAPFTENLPKNYK